MHDMWMGFEAEFVSLAGDYMEVAPLVEPIAGAPVEALTMFDEPDWDSGCWYVCQDSTIDEEYGDGVEIVSAPMLVRNAFTKLRQTLMMMNNVGFVNESCALHINLSSPRMPGVDEVYSHFDAQRWLATFGRSGNWHSKPLVQPYNQFDKTLVVNRHGLTHIEFKHIGGPSYLKDWETTYNGVVDAILAFTKAVLYKSCSLEKTAA